MFRFVLYCLCISLVWTSPLTGLSKKIFLKDVGGRIFNGEDAVLGQFPFDVAIYFIHDGYSEFCGGAIISQNYVLTAGHCVDGAIFAEVVVGFVSFLSPAIIIQSDELILHEEFFINSTVVVNDIGLIKLRQPIRFDDNTQPIALASEPLEAGVEVTVSGWGTTDNAGTNVHYNLTYVTLTTIENSECVNTFGNIILPTVVCAISESGINQSPCGGDSGAPLVANSGADSVHVGLVSFITNEGCETNRPSGYTRTASYLDWIKANSDVV